MYSCFLFFLCSFHYSRTLDFVHCIIVKKERVYSLLSIHGFVTLFAGSFRSVHLCFLHLSLVLLKRIGKVLIDYYSLN